MNLSPHFTLSEAIVSETAGRKGIDNTPNAEMIEQLKLTAAFMEKIRSALGEKPITVTSWYRCDALERVVAGLSQTAKSTGHHPLGAAVDFICPKFGTPRDIVMHLKPMVNTLGIGQLIFEYGNWVHISRLTVPNPINRILTIDSAGVRVFA